MALGAAALVAAAAGAAPPPLIPPFVLASATCSGSTWIVKTLRVLLEQAAGVTMCETTREAGAEMLHPHPDREWRGVRLDKAGTLRRMLTLHRECSAANATMLLKVSTSVSSQTGIPYTEVAHVLQKMRARTALTYRMNVIDRFVCAARDCMATNGIERVWSNNGSVIPMPSNAHECFERRKNVAAPHDATKDPPPTEKIDVTRAQSFFRTLSRWRDSVGPEIALKMDALGYGPRPILPVPYEQLALSGHTPERISWSVAAFQHLLRVFLGREVDAGAIERVLAKGAGKRPMPASHRAAFYNFEFVQSAMRESTELAPALKAMLRDDLPVQVGTGQLDTMSDVSRGGLPGTIEFEAAPGSDVRGSLLKFSRSAFQSGLRAALRAVARAANALNQ